MRLSSLLLASCMLLASSPSIAAQANPTAAQPKAAATAASTSSVPRIQQHTTPNGLTVLVVENHALPLMTVEIAVKNGAMTEPPKYSGLSHLYEHMFFKANAVLPSQGAYMARVNELGIKFNGTTGTERVNYFFTTTTDHADEAMVFMRDALLTLRFDAKELEKERVVVTGEMDRAESNPFFPYQQAMDSLIWYRYPSRKDPLGSRKTVLTATPTMLKMIKRRYYLPNNSVLVVTGDVKASHIFSQADQLYVDWKAGPDPFKRYPLVKHPALRRSQVVMVEKAVRSYTGSFVWHGPSVVAKEMKATYAADALGTYVAEPTSRFQRALVDSGACLWAGLSWYTQRNVGPLSVRYGAEPAKVDRCTNAIMAEIKKLAEPNYITAAELAAATYTLKVDKVREREKPSSFAHIITFWWASAGLDYYKNYVDNVSKITPDDVTTFITTYMKDKPFVYGGLASSKMTQAGMTKTHMSKLVGVAP